MMLNYKLVKSDSSGLSDDDLAELGNSVMSNSIRAVVGMSMYTLQEIVEDIESEGRLGLIGAAYDVATESGAVVGKFSYFVTGGGV